MQRTKLSGGIENGQEGKNIREAVKDEGKANTFQRRDFFFKYLLQITIPQSIHSSHERVLHNVWADFHKQTMVLDILTVEVVHHLKEDVSVFVCRIMITL